MEEEGPVIYGLESRTRALGAQHGLESEAIRFFVGTQSFRSNSEKGKDNQVHLVELDEDTNSISKHAYHHTAGEVWSLSPSPSDPTLLASVYNHITDSSARLRACLWRLPGEDEQLLESCGDGFGGHGDDDAVSSMEVVCEFQEPESEETDTKCLLWHPVNEKNKCVTLTDNRVLVWDIDASSSNAAKLSQYKVLEGKGQPKFTAGRWNPHHNCNQIATANDSHVRGWDIRCKPIEQTFVIENAHGHLVRDLDFNPNRQYYLATCGDDCYTKFWDVRNPTAAVKTLDTHSHWVWSVQYNHFHDQLILTSSSDSRVILTNTVSLSSEPYGHLLDEEEDDDEDGERGDREEDEDHDTREKQVDGTVTVYEEHEESVYGVQWAATDPWIFASLSYDGRLAINRVPRSEKYKILL